MTLRDRFDLHRLAPYWRTVTEWWSTRSLREQVLLGVLVTLAIFALFVLLLAPLREIRNDALEDIHGAALLEARLRNGGGDAAMFKRFRTGTGSAIVTDSAAAAQLTLTEIGADNENVRVKLADAPFDKVVNLIAEIERTSPLRLQTVDIQRQGAAGFVSAEMVFGQ